MIFKNILNGSRSCDFMLIEDESSVSGLHVLKEIISTYNRKGCKIHSLVYEHKTQHFLNRIGYNNLVFHNLLPSPVKPDEAVSSFSSLVDKLTEDISSQQLIVIDSVFYPIILESINKFSRSVSKLRSPRFTTGEPVFTIIGILHKEILDGYDLDCLKSLARTVLDLTKGESSKEAYLRLKHVKSSGTEIKENYKIYLDLQGNLKYETINNTTAVKEEPEKEENMNLNVTFKLSLEEREKESRKKLILPHTKIVGMPSASKIIYEPDVNDDWDDEDPDDDLEI